jgi:hypothetical protein
MTGTIFERTASPTAAIEAASADAQIVVRPCSRSRRRRWREAEADEGLVSRKRRRGDRRPPARGVALRHRSRSRRRGAARRRAGANSARGCSSKARVASAAPDCRGVRAFAGSTSQDVIDNRDGCWGLKEALGV